MREVKSLRLSQPYEGFGYSATVSKRQGMNVKRIDWCGWDSECGQGARVVDNAGTEHFIPATNVLAVVLEPAGEKAKK
jgi:hypothetical protein